jgi:hypothetical protein
MVMKSERRSELVYYSASLSVLIISSVGLVISDYKAVLIPLYGDAPTQLHLTSVLTASTLLAGLFTHPTSSPAAVRVAEDGLPFFGSAYLLVMPWLAHHMAIYTSRWGDSVWGPIVLHLTVLLPILYVFVVSVALHLSPYRRFQKPKLFASFPVEMLLFILLAVSFPHLPNLLPTGLDVSSFLHESTCPSL